MKWIEDLEDMLTTFANRADGPESPEAIKESKRLLTEVERLKVSLEHGRISVEHPDGPIVYSLRRADIADVWRLLDDVRQPGETAPAAVTRLKAAVEQLRERAERAERERDRLLDSYINLGTREDVRRFFGLDAEPAGEEAPP